MAAAQVSIKRVFGHSQRSSPLDKKRAEEDNRTGELTENETKEVSRSMDYEFALREYPRLEGKDVVLRRFTLGDAGDVFEYASDPEVTEHLTWESHGSIEETISVMKKIFLNNPFMYAITLPENDKCIGSIDIRIVEKHNYASFGFCLAKPYWGRGYMTQALELMLELGFKKLDIHRMEGYHSPVNPAVGRVMEKCGMVREGLTRESSLVKGEYRDEILYGVLAKDWQKRE